MQKQIKNSITRKFSLNNFANLVNQYPTEEVIERICGFFWFVRFFRYSEDGVDYLALHYCYKNVNPTVLETYKCRICVENQDPSRNIELVGYKCTEKAFGSDKFMKLNEILAKGSGFLTDGALKIRTEVRVDYYVNDQGIRMFNFEDPFENGITFECQMTNTEAFMCVSYYADKQVIMNHCGRYRSDILAGITKFVITPPLANTSRYLPQFLQLIHGVRTTYSHPTFQLSWAAYFDAPAFFPLIKPSRADTFRWNPCLDHDIPMLTLPFLLKSFKSVGTLQEQVGHWNFNELTREMVKVIVEKFFLLAIDERNDLKMRNVESVDKVQENE